MRERLDPLLASARDALRRIRAALGTAVGAARRQVASRPSGTRPASAPAARRGRPARPAVEPELFAEPHATVVAEPDDDIASITGRIDTAADSNVILLVPKNARAMRNAAVWAHVAAFARRRGIVLAVVSGRRDVRGHASANGLPAARSIARLGARRRRLRLGRRAVTIPALPWRGLAASAIGVGVLISAGSAACYAVPSAEIVIAPPSTEFAVTVRARLSPLATEADIASGMLPARNLRVITTATLSVETTGEAEVPDAPATVRVEFTNGGEQDLTVPAGTAVVDDNGVIFVTDEELTVPAGQTERVDATALDPGPNGNVEAEALRHIDGFPATLTVTNPRAADGGTTMTVPGVGEDDLARARAIADAALDRVATRALTREIGDGRVFPPTQNIAILSETPLANIGDPGEYLLVEYQVVATALALAKDDLATYASELVRTHLEPGTALLPGTATATADGPVEIDGGSVVLTINARGQVAQLFDAEAVGDAVTGARPSVASERLTEMLDLLEPPRITIEPGFVPWRWLPRRASRISFTLTTPGAADEEDASSTPSPTATPTPTATPAPTSVRLDGVRARASA